MSEYEMLKDAIYQTIDDINLWHEVLRQISKMTGITRGTIALRDRVTGGIVAPEYVWEGMDCPLAFGWADGEIESYINNFMSVDPWIEIEQLFHPTPPYALSDHIDGDALKQSPFRDWLAPIGIGDSVVADIGSTPPYWVSMNLYFPAEDFSARESALVLLTRLQKTMQDAWRYGLQARAPGYEKSCLGYLLELQPDPGILLDPLGKMIFSNQAAKKQMEDKSVPVSLIDDSICFDNKEVQQWFKQTLCECRVNGEGNRTSTEISTLDDELELKLAPLQGAEEKTGLDPDIFLLTIKANPIANEIDLHPVWENPELTRRERQLVEFMAKGGRISEFVRQQDMAKSTGHFHWANVKSKLDVKDRAELISNYQIYLQNL